MEYKDIKEFAKSMRKNPTEAEELFWKYVKARRFLGLRFNRQYIIEHSNIMGKKSYFIPDFYCFELKLIIEIDGSIHNQQIEYDIIREDILKEMGNKIIRFTNDEVSNDWASAAQKLRKFVEENYQM